MLEPINPVCAVLVLYLLQRLDAPKPISLAYEPLPRLVYRAVYLGARTPSKLLHQANSSPFSSWCPSDLSDPVM